MRRAILHTAWVLPTVVSVSLAACGGGKPDTGTTCVPGVEVPYDGIDQNCDGADLTDVDGDGHGALDAGGDDCDDEDASTYPGAPETPYDGVDQDCDGTDLADVDGDGHEAVATGGDDCDDGNASTFPGASETPYDGIDQDCDGADLADVDGDGHDAIAVGGDDCDDSDATSFPGAAEVSGDGADNDCDGHVDEVEAHVCGDGTGDYTTIQEAVDGTPDGGTIIICPGTYTESVTIEDRVLDIVGGGGEPGDVVIDVPRDSTGLYVKGSLSEVTVSWLAFVGHDQMDALVKGEAAGSVLIDSIETCTSGEGTLGMFSFAGSESFLSAAEIRNSHICGGANRYDLTVIQWAYGHLRVDGNVFEGSTGVVFLSGEGGELSNNIVHDGEQYLQLANVDTLLPSEISIENNTFSGLESLGVCIRVDSTRSMPSVSVTNNIVDDVSSWFDDVSSWFCGGTFWYWPVRSFPPPTRRLGGKTCFAIG